MIEHFNCLIYSRTSVEENNKNFFQLFYRRNYNKKHESSNVPSRCAHFTELLANFFNCQVPIPERLL